MAEWNPTKQLPTHSRDIEMKYASYLHRIFLLLKKKSLTAIQLSSFLFDYEPIEKLQKAETLDSIFAALYDYYSFWDYEVFQRVAERFDLTSEREYVELQYVEDFEAYIQKEKVSEFIQFNPSLTNYSTESSDSKELILEYDIDTTTCSLAKVRNLMKSIAAALNAKESTLRLARIEENRGKGSLILKCLIPASIANGVLASDLEETEVCRVTCKCNTLDVGTKKLTAKSESKLNFKAMFNSDLLTLTTTI